MSPLKRNASAIIAVALALVAWWQVKGGSIPLLAGLGFVQAERPRPPDRFNAVCYQCGRPFKTRVSSRENCVCPWCGSILGARRARELYSYR